MPVNCVYKKAHIGIVKLSQNIMHFHGLAATWRGQPSWPLTKWKMTHGLCIKQVIFQYT